jgi:alkanesulfonate monooxygenase SsuD/methylene tetrahydromethanopterin reductase-like flavin-dependent oxidoreductase (luciferase family)
VSFRLSDLPRQTEAYRAALGDAAGSVAINRVTLVAATQSEVDDRMQRHLATTLQAYVRPGVSVERALEEVVLIGTPSTISERLARYEAAGVTHVFARLSLDDTPPEVARDTIDVLGRDVIPRFA